MQAMTKGDLVKFLDMITSKGWVNPHTGAAYKAAVNKILGEIPAEDDPRKIDVRTAVFRYNNLHPGELKPASLKKYEARVTQAVSLFAQYMDDPTTFKAPQRVPAGAKPEKAKKTKGAKKLLRDAILPRQPPTDKTGDVAPVSTGTVALRGEAPTSIATRTVTGTATEANLVLPFPLRNDYIAQVVVPIDITTDEADRLCAFIKTLARVSK